MVNLAGTGVSRSPSHRLTHLPHLRRSASPAESKRADYPVRGLFWRRWGGAVDPTVRTRRVARQKLKPGTRDQRGKGVLMRWPLLFGAAALLAGFAPFANAQLPLPDTNLPTS